MIPLAAQKIITAKKNDYARQAIVKHNQQLDRIIRVYYPIKYSDLLSMQYMTRDAALTYAYDIFYWSSYMNRQSNYYAMRVVNELDRIGWLK